MRNAADEKPQAPQIPSRQSESNAIGSCPPGDQPFVDDVQHFEKDMSGDTFSAV